MSEKPDPEDPLVATEALLEKARRETERQALAWQKAHQATDQGYDLVRHFNSERKQLSGNEQFEFTDTIFANASGISLFNLAKSIEHPTDATLTLGTSQILLSGLQSNIASYVSTPIDFGINTPFPKTVAILESQQVPIEDRLPALKRRLSNFSDHFSDMITAIEADLMNQSNPLTLSNAAKNLRETLTAFIHTVAPDGVLELWPDCERDEKNRPTRRSRLACQTFLGLAKRNWPKPWVNQVEKRIDGVLDSFHDLNKFTHINEGTADALKTATVSLDRFVSEYLLYLDTADEAHVVLLDLLRGPVEAELTELPEGELHSWFEEGVSHAYTDEVHCEELRINEITQERLAFSGRCRVTGTFQHGSNSDVRRGDGVEWRGAKYFTFSGTISPGDRNDLKIEPVEFLR